MSKKQVNLSVGRGEKLPVSKGAGLTAKGRAKYNKETGSNLKPPTKDKDDPRHKNFCNRSSDWDGERKTKFTVQPAPSRCLHLICSDRLRLHA